MFPVSNGMEKQETKFQLYFFAVLFLVVLALAFFVFLPFLIPISFASALAVVCRPLYGKLMQATKNKEGLSAFLTVLISIVVLFIPLTFFSLIILQEARDFSEHLSNADSMAPFVAQFGEWFSHFIPNFSLNIGEYTGQIIDWIVQNLGTIFAGIAQMLLGVFLTLLAFYYLLKEGGRLSKSLVILSPLPDTYDREILNKMENAINSVIRGALIVAIVQGVLTGIGLAIFGVPSPALLGTAAAIAALIPGIGTALILIPGIIFLFTTGSTTAAIGLLIWGVTAVGLIDNLLGPKLMKRNMNIHSFLILLSVIGGLTFFGPSGFLLGPLVLSLLFALIEIYRILMHLERV